MSLRWIALGGLALILLGFDLGCTHQPDIRPSPSLGAVAETQKTLLSVLVPQKGICEAAAPGRGSLRNLQHEVDIFVNENITFAYDTYTVSPPAAEILKVKAAFLATHPSLIIKIEGYCDERGTVEYNLALGDRRAKAARDYLCALGIAPKRTLTVSYGEERPLDPSQTEEAWAKNRRCQFLIFDSGERT